MAADFHLNGEFINMRSFKHRSQIYDSGANLRQYRRAVAKFHWFKPNHFWKAFKLKNNNNKNNNNNNKNKNNKNNNNNNNNYNDII